jgi:hypothetical protein
VLRNSLNGSLSAKQAVRRRIEGCDKKQSSSVYSLFSYFIYFQSYNAPDFTACYQVCRFRLNPENQIYADVVSLVLYLDSVILEFSKLTDMV